MLSCSSTGISTLKFCLYLISLSTGTNTTKTEVVSLFSRAFSAYLADVHARITAQRLRRHQSIGANHSREQTPLINLLNGRAIDKVDNTSFIHCNTCAGERERERQNDFLEVPERKIGGVRRKERTEMLQSE